MAWLDRTKAPIRPGVGPTADVVLALEAWNTLGGLDWSGLEFVADMLGIEDIDLLVAQLVVIRDKQRGNK